MRHVASCALTEIHLELQFGDRPACPAAARGRPGYRQFPRQKAARQAVTAACRTGEGTRRVMSKQPLNCRDRGVRPGCTALGSPART